MSPRKRSLQQQSSLLTLTSKLTASNGGTSHQFGDENGVAISNNRIVVGATGYNNEQGAAYIFTDPNNPSTGRSYSQSAILVASDGQTGDWFGNSVDIDGDVLVVGATLSEGPGAVYVFRIFDDNRISQIAKITGQNGATADNFGYSVAIHGKFILVGALGVSNNVSEWVGSAHLFGNPSNDPNNTEWTHIMQFQPNDLTDNDAFGYFVAMDDQIAVIGTNDFVDFDAHYAYVFVPVDDNMDSLSLWTQMAKLTGPNNSYFGYSVAVAGNTIVVGAPDYIKSNGNQAGAVFIFTKIEDTTSSLTWTQTSILLAADGAAGDSFGISVSISKDASTIVVGANMVDNNSSIIDSGTAYLFRNSNTTMMAVGWTQVGKYVATVQESYDWLGSSIAIENSVVVVGAYGDDSETGSVYIADTENSSELVPTFQPTPSPTSNPTNPNNGNGSNTNNQSSPPAASTPTPPDNNTTATLSDPTNDPNSKPDNNNVTIAAIGGVVVVVVALGLGIAFFHYRLKRERLRLVEQQQQQPSPPLVSSGNDRVEAVTTDEIPITVDVIFPLQSMEDRTMPAEVFVDPPSTHAPPDAAAAVGKKDDIDAKRGLPEFKDQTQSVTPPRPGPSRMPVPSSRPNRNSQRNRYHPQYQERQEELPGTQAVQQQQQQLCDPPAAVDLLQGQLPQYKDQVSGE